jgi:hypothetical protein
LVINDPVAPGSALGEFAYSLLESSIFMKPISGVYLGWIPPHGNTWEPLYRTIRTGNGYQSDRTRLYASTIERYPGLELALSYHPNPTELPFALKKRTPLARSDYEWKAHLPYPNLDIFEYIGRTGGMFSADSFTICPIVEPNDDGTYTYETVLWKFDPQVRDVLTELTQIETIFRADDTTLVTANGRELGELLPHFTHLGDAISKIEIVKISEPHEFLGRQILISFNTVVELFAKPPFDLANKVLLNV